MSASESSEDRKASSGDTADATTEGSAKETTEAQDILSQVEFSPELLREKEKLEKEAAELGVRYDQLKVHLEDEEKAAETTKQMTAILARNSEIVAELQEVYKKAGLAPNPESEAADSNASTAKPSTTSTGTKRLSSGAASNAKPAKRVKKNGESDADDIDDVTKLAGVDIEEEENAGLEDLQGDDDDTEDHEEGQFCNFVELKYRIATVARKFGLRNVAVEACQYLAFSMQQQLRDMLENVVRNSHHRVGVYRPHLKSTYTTYDPNPQLRLQQRLFAGRHRTPINSSTSAQSRTDERAATTSQQHSPRNQTNASATQIIETQPTSTSTTDTTTTTHSTTTGSTNTSSTPQTQPSTTTDAPDKDTSTDTQDNTTTNTTTPTADSPADRATRTIQLCDLMEYMESTPALRTSKLLYASYLKPSDAGGDAQPTATEVEVAAAAPVDTT